MKPNILFYASQPGQFPMEITCVNSFSYSHACDFFPIYNKDSLVEFIQSREQNGLIAILTAISEEEIKGLVLHKDLFDSIPIILMISDESDAMLHEAHKLHPRFLATVGDDFSDVLSIVKNLFEDMQKKNTFASGKPGQGYFSR